MPAPISFRLLSGICPVCAVDIKTQCISNNDDLVGRFRPRFLALLLHQRIDGRGRMDITTIRKGKTVAWLKRPERSAQCAWPCGFVVQGYLTGLPVAGRCNGRLQRQQHRCLGGGYPDYSIAETHTAHVCWPTLPTKCLAIGRIVIFRISILRCCRSASMSWRS